MDIENKLQQLIDILNNTNRRIDRASGLSDSSTRITKPRVADQIEAASMKTRCSPDHLRRVPSRPSDSRGGDRQDKSKTFTEHAPNRMELPENETVDKNVKILSKTTNSVIAKTTAESNPTPKNTGGGNTAPPTDLEAATKTDTVNPGLKMAGNKTNDVDKPVIDKKLDELARHLQRLSRVIDENITQPKPQPKLPPKSSTPKKKVPVRHICKTPNRAPRIMDTPKQTRKQNSSPDGYVVQVVEAMVHRPFESSPRPKRLFTVDLNLVPKTNYSNTAPPETKRKRSRYPEIDSPTHNLEPTSLIMNQKYPDRYRQSVFDSKVMLLEHIKMLSSNEPHVQNLQSLTIMQMNVRTLTSEKLPYLKDLLNLHHPEILLLNEIGVNKNTPVFPIIDCYQCVTYDIKAAFSGVAIYVQRAVVPLVRLVTTANKLAMAQIAGIIVSGITIYTVYRSPSMKEHEEELFCDWILSLNKDNTLVIGDLNLHVRWDDYSSKTLGHRRIAEAFLEGGYCQYQYEPTFDSGRTLDVTLCNSLGIVTSCTTDPYFDAPGKIYDHYPTLTTISVELDVEVKKTIFLRKKRNKDVFYKSVEKGMKTLNAKHLEPGSETSIDEMDSDLANLLLKAEEEATPKMDIDPRKLKFGAQDTMSQKTQEIANYAREMRKKGYYKRAQQVSKQLHKSLQRDRAKWMQARVNKLKKDRNEVWNMVDKAMASTSTNGALQREDGTLTSDPVEKNNILAERYSSVLTPKTYPKCNPNSTVGCDTKEFFGDIEFDPAIIDYALKKSNNSMAKDTRKLSMPLYRESKELIVDYLTKMFNKVIDEERMALIWLVAMTLPIPKGGDLSLAKQWRGIVLEATPVRVWEAAYNLLFVWHLERIDFFHKRQFGFIRKRSTIHNLLEFWNFVIMIMKEYGRCDVIYADTSAAFDKLSHGILLDKLHKECGVWGKAWRALEAWTSNRLQFVYWNGVSSDAFDVTSSCMQGSSLGTTLWNCYFNEVACLLDEWIEELEIVGCDFWIYADDLKICYVPTRENTKKINILLARLQKKMDDLKLKFNGLKFKVLTFGGDRNLKLEVLIKDDEGKIIPIQRTNVERDLGVMIDSDGSFKTQAKKALGVAKATAKILTRACRGVDFVTKVQLWEAHIFARMGYGSEIWWQNTQGFNSEANKIYSDFFKFVVVPPDRYPPLTPQQAMLAKDLRMMFMIKNEMSPLAEDEYFPPQTQEPRTRSQARQQINAEVWNKWQKTHIVTRNREIWNSIPPEIRNTGDLPAFEEYVKKTIIEKMPCNKIRTDMMDGELRRRAKKAEKIKDKAAYIANINRQLGNPRSIDVNEVLLHGDYKDDFKHPNVCLKTLQRKNRKDLKRLEQIAPWMTLCTCGRAACFKEIQDFEKLHGKPLRDYERVLLRKEKVIVVSKAKRTKDVYDYEDLPDLFND